MLRPACSAFVLAIALIFAILFASPAHALLIIFGDRTVFNQFIGPHELITFEEFPVGILCPPAHPFISDPCTLTTGGATFVGTTGLPPQPPRPFLDQRPELEVDAGLGGPLSKGLVENAL